MLAHSMANPADPGIAKPLARFVTFCSVLSVGFGLLVLTGWALHIQALKSIPRGQVAVKANTAVCFVLLGVALWLVRKEGQKQGWRWAARVLGLVTSIIGALSFLEAWQGWELGIDQLLFMAGPEDVPGSVRVGLMSPISAIGFCLLGSAVALLDFSSRWSRVLTQLTTSIAATAAIFGVLDFLLDPTETHTHIAPATAFILLLMSLACAFCRPKWGVIALLASSSSGGKTARRLLPPSIAIPILIGWFRWKGEELGIYNDWTGVAMMTVSTAIMVGGIAVWTAFVIDRSDREREKADQARRASDERFRVLLDGIKDYAIYMLDPKGIVVSWNAGAANINGYHADEILGKHVSCFYTAEDRKKNTPQQELQAALRNGRFEGQAQHVRKDGSLFWANIIISPMRDEAGNLRGFSNVVRDISELRRAEQKLQRMNRTLRALGECTDALMRAPDEPTMLQRVCDVVVGVAGYPMAWVGYAEQDEKKSVRPVAVSGFEEGYLTTADISWADVERGRGPTGSAIRNAKTTVCDDVTIDPRFAPWLGQALRCGFRSTIGIPLKIGEDVLGALMIYALEAGEFGSDEQRLLEELASNLTYAIMTLRARTASARAEEERRQASRYARNLIEASLDPLVTIRKDGKIMDVNRATEQATGVPRPELIGSDFSNYFTEPEKARVVYRQVFEKGFVKDYALAIRHHSGRVIDVLYNATVFENENGQVEGVFAAARDITQRKHAEEKIQKLNRELEERVQQRTAQLRESEQSVRRKLDSILSPEGDLGRLKLADILDVPGLRSLIEDFHHIVHMPIAIIDTKGELVAGVGWQDVCTKFHRVHPDACKNCVDSDTQLSSGVAPGEFKLYKCKNHIWDVATPITTGGEHVGNLFLGQFFLTEEPLDLEVFRAQSARYGFDEKQYLLAVEGVPRLSREEVNVRMGFLAKLAEVVSQLSYSSIKLARSREETRRVNMDLAASVKELEAFTYSVSHDLRAPLRHISGFSKILIEEFSPGLPEDAQHHLRRIEEGTRRMGVLVDDLLNLARVGRHDLSLQVTGFRALVEEVISSLKSDVGDRQIEWQIGSLPYLGCDPGLMKQVFQNLLANAVKFTRPRSKAIIEIGQKEHDGAPVIYVRDNGVGFSMKYADKLFGVFQRLHRAEDFEGTGVGLATVQRIIQKHGGRIWTEAELDKGATFYFNLGDSEKGQSKAEVQ